LDVKDLLSIVLA